MKFTRHSVISKAIIFIIMSVVLASPLPGRTAAQSTLATADTACRFGITSALGSAGYDIQSLGVGAYLDWGAVINPSLPEGVEYIRVLRLREDVYSQTLANLPAWVDANMGGVWLVGNEPDTTYEDQDGLLAEVYADRYYELARIIRQHDPSAKIGFGTIVQPSPIRIRYLQRAWNRLVLDAGSAAAASNLVDLWTIHSFILNEEPSFWGTGIPPGFELDYDDAFIIPIDQLDLTYSIEIFTQRIIDFRQWMADIGEREKPLWITEYGSLLPPVDPIGGPDYFNVSDADTAAYMLQTFDFMLSSSDALTGMPADGNQLVQRWYWYSLNDHRYRFGGSLYNPDYPDYGDWITLVGQAFIDYQPLDRAQPDLYPASLHVSPVGYNSDRSLVNYRMYLKLGNSLTADTGASAQVQVYDGDPGSGGSLIAGPITTEAVQRCGGTRLVTADWMGVEPLTEHTLCVVVDPVGVEDSDTGNNKACYSVTLGVPVHTLLPLVVR